MKKLAKAYLAISKWARTGHVPTFEEYMEIGMQTAMDHFAAYSFIAMEELDENQMCEWYNSRPKMLEAVNGVFRLKNDIATYEVIIIRTTTKQSHQQQVFSYKLN